MILEHPGVRERHGMDSHAMLSAKLISRISRKQAAATKAYLSAPTASCRSRATGQFRAAFLTQTFQPR